MRSERRGKGRKRIVVMEEGGRDDLMLGLLDMFHAFVVLQRFRYRCRSRVTDVVGAETARIAINTEKKVQGIVLDLKRGCAHPREGKGRKRNSGDGGRRREMI